MAAAQKPIQVGPGPLVHYYSDLSSGLLAPEDMRIENLAFSVRIDPTGAITAETPATQVVSRYNFAIRRVAGFAMNPLAVGNAGALVTFQIIEQGRNFNVFKRPVNMQSILATGGAGNLAEWDGVYICVPGTDLQVQWTVDTARWPALVGATREFGIQIMGDYVICR